VSAVVRRIAAIVDPVIADTCEKRGWTRPSIGRPRHSPRFAEPDRGLAQRRCRGSAARTVPSVINIWSFEKSKTHLPEQEADRSSRQ
jgi:hypothetical protein